MTDDLVKAAREALEAQLLAVCQREAEMIARHDARIKALEAENAALIQDRNRWAEEAQAETSPIVFALEAEVARLRGRLA